jgi:DNA-binding transcriptional regulator WhiA
VPNSIEVKVEALMNVIKSANLNALQTAAVLNEIIESMDLSKLPYKLKKDLRLKIQ